MNDLWVARDADEDGSLKLFAGKPRLGEFGFVCGDGEHDDYLYHIPEMMFHDLKPGECRRLVLAEKEPKE